MRKTLLSLICACAFAPVFSYAATFTTGVDTTKPATEASPANAAEDIDFVMTYPNIPKHEFNPLYVGNYPIGPFEVSGFMVGSYNYLNRLNVFSSDVNNRLFDIQQNGLTFHQALFNVLAQPEHGFGGELSLLMGRDANITAPYGMNPLFSGSQDLALDPYQGYLSFNESTWNVIVGRFMAYSGFEYDYTPFNPNFSVGLVPTFTQPSTLTGARFTYTGIEHWEFYASLNDGWDTVRDWSRRKTLELGTQYNISHYSWQAYIYNGQERVTDAVSSGPTGIRTLLDLFVIDKATDKLTLVGEVDYFNQSKAELPTPDVFDEESGEFVAADEPILNRAIQYGMALYANYYWTDAWRTAIRGEYYNDPNGYGTGVSQAMEEATLTVGYQPWKNFELRGEARHDFSNNGSFVNLNKETTANNMQSYALVAILTA